jgi:hypothetical protein
MPQNEHLMRNLLILFALLVRVKVAIAQAGAIPTFNLNEETALLSRLFDSKLFSANGEVMWRPVNFADEVDANYSDDGYLYTAIDTVMYYTAFTISRAVVVFETLHYEKGEVSDCHSCGADISIAIFDTALDGKWQISQFKKHCASLGSYGENGHISLIQFGEQQWCLSMKMEWTGQGIYGEYLSFIDLESLEKVFNYTAHEDNNAALETPDRTYSFEKSIHFISNQETKSGWWDFELVARGTKPGEQSEQTVPANKVERFSFDWETNTYMRVCGAVNSKN